MTPLERINFARSYQPCRCRMMSWKWWESFYDSTKSSETFITSCLMNICCNSWLVKVLIGYQQQLLNFEAIFLMILWKNKKFCWKLSATPWNATEINFLRNTYNKGNQRGILSSSYSFAIQFELLEWSPFVRSFIQIKVKPPTSENKIHHLPSIIWEKTPMRAFETRKYYRIM